MAEFRMPALGADMEMGTVTRWLVKPGDIVKRGDIVAEIETEKATMEAEIFQGGQIDELIVPEGERVPVGTVLATLHPVEAAEPTRLPTPAQPPPPIPEPLPAAFGRVAAAAPAMEPATVAPLPVKGVRVSPLARRTAARLGVDVSVVTGTGPGGAIRRGDVEAFAQRASTRAEVPTVAGPAPPLAPAIPTPAEAPAPAPTTSPAPLPTQALPSPRPAPASIVVPSPAAPPTAEDRLASMRQAVGALMARSKREVPHYYVGTHIDMSRGLDWMEEQNLERRVSDRLVPAALLLKATALAAREMPQMNGFWIDGAFRPADGVHLGVAISVRGGGLIAPAIHDVDAKSLDELMADLKAVVERARAGRLRSSEMSDPTLTVTNLGDSGVETVYGVIYAPQVALVGFGRIVERAWAEHGMVGARRVVHATLSADHRASDGHTGARFLAAIDRHLQEPEGL